MSARSARWQYLGLDAFGFVPMERLVSQEAELGTETFLQLLRETPGLVWEEDMEGEGGEGRVAFLVKRAGNPFADMIAIGRAPESDVTIDRPTVSKVHASLLRQEGRWLLVDQSRNGTFVNGRRLEPATGHALQEGDRIRLGHDVVLRFCGPTTLLGQLRERAGAHSS